LLISWYARITPNASDYKNAIYTLQVSFENGFL